MKRKTILNHQDFLTPIDCISGRCEFFVVKTKSSKIPNNPRYGIIVTKRTLKLAIHRNRAKRLLRDWIAFNEDLMIPELDYVFIAYNTILDATRDIGRQRMRKIFKNIARQYKKNETKK